MPLGHIRPAVFAAAMDKNRQTVFVRVLQRIAVAAVLKLHAVQPAVEFDPHETLRLHKASV